MGSPAVDLDALASQHGGTPDYESLAKQHGGTAEGTTEKRGFFGTIYDAVVGAKNEIKDYFQNGIPVAQGAKTMARGLQLAHKEQAGTLTADEKKELDGLNLSMPQGYGSPMEGTVAAPAASAMQSVKEGDPKAAAAHLLMGYGVPLAADAGITYGPEAAAAAARVASKTPPVVARVVGGAVGGGAGHAVMPGAGTMAGGALGQEAGAAVLDRIKQFAADRTPTEVTEWKPMRPGLRPKPKPSPIANPNEPAAALRPEWRQQIVNELNPDAPPGPATPSQAAQESQATAQPVAPPAGPLQPPGYVPPHLANNPKALEIAQRLKAEMDANTAGPDVIPKTAPKLEGAPEAGQFLKAQGHDMTKIAQMGPTDWRKVYNAVTGKDVKAYPSLPWRKAAVEAFQGLQ